jgi:hypothetical protein
MTVDYLANIYEASEKNYGPRRPFFKFADLYEISGKVRGHTVKFTHNIM